MPDPPLVDVLSTTEQAVLAVVELLTSSPEVFKAAPGMFGCGGK